tara:strand:+ start:329 stop:1195 length:867 start_codon:yes stop_codon:yes gene_type:complete
MMRHLSLVLLMGVLGCPDVGLVGTQFPLYVAGTDIAEPVVAMGDVSVTIDRADLAFGPLYLCAGATAGDLCDTARYEWLDSVVVDTTLSESVMVGELSGTTGTVRSWMYDLGFSSQLTRDDPFVLQAAKELGDASFILEGTAVVEGLALPFSVTVPIQQTEDTELGVPVIRKGSSDSFYREIDTSEQSLLVRFDSSAWITGMDFRSFVSDDTCTNEGPAMVCEGATEHICEDETIVSSRDCSSLNQVCVASLGCQDRLTIEEGSEAYRSLRNALNSGERPSFTWDYKQ